MTEILVDSSVIINVLQKKADDKTKAFLEERSISISILTHFEIAKFFLKIGKSEELEAVKRMLDNFDTKEVTIEICAKAAKIAHSDRMSMADAIIYATALENGIGLITSDSDLKGKPAVIYAKPR